MSKSHFSAHAAACPTPCSSFLICPLSFCLHCYFPLLLLAATSTDLGKGFSWHDQLCASSFLLFSKLCCSSVSSALSSILCTWLQPSPSQISLLVGVPAVSLQPGQMGTFFFLHLKITSSLGQGVSVPSFQTSSATNSPFPCLKLRLQVIFFFSVLPVCWPSIEFCPSAMLYDTFFSIPFNHHQLPLQVSPSSSCSEKRACFPGQVTPHNLFAEITHNNIEKIFFSRKDTSTLRTRSNQFFSCSDCH